ncbi:EF-hand domain-containing protein [Azospirillum sp. sgz301742]
MKTTTCLAAATVVALLSLASVAAAQQGQPTPSKRVAPMFEALDTNGDGVISLEEFLNRPSEGGALSPESRQHLEIRFRQLDSDGNGTLSHIELVGRNQNLTPTQH